MSNGIKIIQKSERDKTELDCLIIFNRAFEHPKNFAMPFQTASEKNLPVKIT